MTNWQKELLEKLSKDDNLDEKHANGVYDMALEMAETIEAKGMTDYELTEYIYNAIKHGDY